MYLNHIFDRKGRTDLASNSLAQTTNANKLKIYEYLEHSLTEIPKYFQYQPDFLVSCFSS